MSTKPTERFQVLEAVDSYQVCGPVTHGAKKGELACVAFIRPWPDFKTGYPTREECKEYAERICDLLNEQGQWVPNITSPDERES